MTNSQAHETPSQEKLRLVAPLVEYLDRIRGDRSEVQFERDLGLKRNAISNIKRGRFPGQQNLVLIRKGTKADPEFFWGLIEAPFEDKKANEAKSEEKKITQKKIVNDSEDETQKLLLEIKAKVDKLLQSSNSNRMANASTARDRARGREQEIAELLEISVNYIFEWTNSSGPTLYVDWAKIIPLARFLEVDPQEIANDLHPDKRPNSSSSQRIGEDTGLEDGNHFLIVDDAAQPPPIPNKPYS